MSGLRGLPPGRAGRLWLERRTRAARRAADLLDRKLRILRQEEQRLELLALRSGEEWRRQHAVAERWLLRAALIAHRRGIRLVADQPSAELTVSWVASMGVQYPVVESFSVPERGSGAAVPASATLDPAAAACASALSAAVRAAAAQSALRTLRTEVAVTRRRLRAVEDRWLPRLDEAAHGIRLTLEEQERGDAARLRWAAERAEVRR